MPVKHDHPLVIFFVLKFDQLENHLIEDGIELSRFVEPLNDEEINKFEGILSLLAELYSVYYVISEFNREGDKFSVPTDPKFIKKWNYFKEKFASTVFTIISGPNYRVANDDVLDVIDLPRLDRADQFIRDLNDKISKASAIINLNNFEKHVAASNVAPEQAEDMRRFVTPRDYNPLYKMQIGDLLVKYSSLNVEDYGERWNLADAIAKKRAKAVKETFDFEVANAPEHTTIMEADSNCRINRENYDILFKKNDLRGRFRREKLVPFVNVPTPIANALSSTSKDSLHEYLSQAQNCFVEGSFLAVFALLRAMKEKIQASKNAPKKVPDNIWNELNMIGLLANSILHGGVEKNRIKNKDGTVNELLVKQVEKNYSELIRHDTATSDREQSILRYIEVMRKYVEWG